MCSLLEVKIQEVCPAGTFYLHHKLSALQGNSSENVFLLVLASGIKQRNCMGLETGSLPGWKDQMNKCTAPEGV